MHEAWIWVKKNSNQLVHLWVMPWTIMSRTCERMETLISRLLFKFLTLQLMVNQRQLKARQQLRLLKQLLLGTQQLVYKLGQPFLQLGLQPRHQLGLQPPHQLGLQPGHQIGLHEQQVTSFNANVLNNHFTNLWNYNLKLFMILSISIETIAKCWNSFNNKIYFNIFTTAHSWSRMS